LRRLLVFLTFLILAGIGGLAVVSSRLSAEPWVGPLSDHFDGRTFSNLDPLPDKSLADLFRWQLTSDKRPWTAWIHEPAGPPPPERVNDRTIRVTWVNHATVLVQMDGVNIITDPIWSERPSPIPLLGPKRRRAPGLRFEDLPPIDMVVVSHNHYDHMDIPTLTRLAARGDAPILVGLGNTSYLSPRGVRHTRDVDWWDSTRVGDVRVTAVPVQHWSARSRSDRRHTLWTGYVFEGPSGRVYFGGDTGYGRHFALVRARLGAADVALLPIGAYLPIWFMKDAHLSPAEAVRASEDLGARVAIPIHFDTFQLGDDGDREPLQDLEAALVANQEQRGVWRVARHGTAEVLGPEPAGH
jgi:L-ascorbate metabolism protein UlaG (beta-lactamase superfamily)